MLYIKYKWLLLKLIQCCMGFLFFLVEIHLVYLYNTGKGKQLGVGKLTSISAMAIKHMATSIYR